jgi:hypothetical protein
MAYCNFFHHVDQYEMAMAMKAFGVTSIDRQAIEARRDSQYKMYRSKFQNASSHGDFCIRARSHPFFIKAGRRGSPLIPGSDTNKQPEKIELFGDFLGVVAFCKIPIDDERWGKFLFDMGVKSESVPAIGTKAIAVRRALLAEHSNPARAQQVCDEARKNPSIYRFGKQ